MTEDRLLSVRDLEKHYPIRSGLLRRVGGHVKAVDGISFDVHEGETFGLVGESGCGKSTTATSLLRLEEPTAGRVYFDGENITANESTDQKQFRRRAQMVFQDPTTAFDPRMTVGASVAEPLAIHGVREAHRRNEIVADLLERVGLDAADAHRFPHEFSGGQKQRIALARALVLNPDLLVADEPVSALDVSVQAEILSLLDSLQSELGLAMLLISHDLGVVRQICDRVGVMYLGEIVEKGPTADLFANPQHPYTEALLSSIPSPDPDQRGESVELTGDVPDPSNPPSGCSFHTRCPRVIPPADLALETQVFRNLLDFRFAVEEGDLDDGAASDAAAVRAEYDLPSPLRDKGAERALATALEAVLAGDTGAAAERLGRTFTTVCERDRPVLTETVSDHLAACHLHETERTLPERYVPE
ncbi:MAG: oligopeptide/dipeptide ABC transporter ATP-binding protein [Haloarculaceae archaeon]